ncbi:hypothetical protein AB0D94_37165 [Streptomyces sp. NPDC048255]|uniref:hypothetical protein n=1 Tax=Streptomyces sp. NPDC048255 TaxID=3154713 RepID=UPI00340DF326
MIVASPEPEPERYYEPEPIRRLSKPPRRKRRWPGCFGWIIFVFLAAVLIETLTKTS